MEEIDYKEVGEIKKISDVLRTYRIDDSNLVYMPQIPMVGSGIKQIVMEQVAGMRVARLVSAGGD